MKSIFYYLFLLILATWRTKNWQYPLFPFDIIHSSLAQEKNVVMDSFSFGFTLLNLPADIVRASNAEYQHQQKISHI